MCKQADRPLNDFIQEQYNQGVFPFDRDLLTTVELFDYLKEKKRMKVTRMKEVANALELIGGKPKKQCPVATVGDRATIWIIRNHDEYANLTAVELGRKYAPFYHDSKGGN